MKDFQGYYWSEEEVNNRLRQKMVTAFDLVWKVKEEYGVTMRKACYIKALKQLIETQNIKGI